MARLEKETTAKREAEERVEAANHEISILRLDLKVAQDEIGEAKQLLSTAQSKVWIIN